MPASQPPKEIQGKKKSSTLFFTTGRACRCRSRAPLPTPRPTLSSQPVECADPEQPEPQLNHVRGARAQGRARALQLVCLGRVDRTVLVEAVEPRAQLEHVVAQPAKKTSGTDGGYATEWRGSVEIHSRRLEEVGGRVSGTIVCRSKPE